MAAPLMQNITKNILESFCLEAFQCGIVTENQYHQLVGRARARIAGKAGTSHHNPFGLSTPSSTPSTSSAPPQSPLPPFVHADQQCENGGKGSLRAKLNPAEDLVVVSPESELQCYWRDCNHPGNARELWTHLTTVHKSDIGKITQCLWMGCASVLQRGSLKKHMESHFQTNRRQCIKCKEVIRIDSYLGRHGLAKHCTRKQPTTPTPSRETRKAIPYPRPHSLLTLASPVSYGPRARRTERPVRISGRRVGSTSPLAGPATQFQHGASELPEAVVSRFVPLLEFYTPLNAAMLPVTQPITPPSLPPFFHLTQSPLPAEAQDTVATRPPTPSPAITTATSAPASPDAQPEVEQYPEWFQPCMDAHASSSSGSGTQSVDDSTINLIQIFQEILDEHGSSA